jgi:hypothetical protein
MPSKYCIHRGHIGIPSCDVAKAGASSHDYVLAACQHLHVHHGTQVRARIASHSKMGDGQKRWNGNRL